MITFDDNLRLLLSPRLKQEMGQRAVAENFGAYAGEALCLPDDATPPDPAFLAGHRAGVFRGAWSAAACRRCEPARPAAP